jgi:steroid 5-alpha reductase family enzyme
MNNLVSLHGHVVIAVFVLAALTFVSLLFITAPYGRHQRSGWGPTLAARWAWVLMELPAVLGFLWFFSQGQNRAEMVPLVLLGIWQIHYVHRTFIFPMRMSANARPMPLVIALLGVSFNLVNAWINATWISHLGQYSQDWLTDPRFLLGVTLFAIGMVANLWSDQQLFAIRRKKAGYEIPDRGLYRWVCCPNYLGELIEWCGWALLTWSTAGLAFAVYTAANLVPRALAHRRWYMETFTDFPANRKALIPGLL